MVSERKNRKNVTKCCSQILKTDFCPHCGQPPKSKSVIYPQRFIIGFHINFLQPHRDKEEESFIEKFEVPKNITIEYELTEKNGDVNLISLSDGIDQFRLVKFGSVDIHGNWL